VQALVAFAALRLDSDSKYHFFQLDLQTGERIGNAFWHQGALYDAFIGDYNEDGQSELVSVGINNGLERNVIFSLDLSELNGQAPAPKNYRIYGVETANFNNYLLLPATDFTQILGANTGETPLGGLVYSNRTKDSALYCSTESPT